MEVAALSPLDVDARFSSDRSGSCQTCVPASEADHRIANHLGMLSGFVQLKAKDLVPSLPKASRAIVQLTLDAISAQIQMMSRLHRSLASRTPRSGLDLSDHLHDIGSPFMSGLSGAIVLTENLSPGCIVRDDQILPLTQIVSEVLTNAIKYSHVNNQPGKVRLACHKLQDGQIEIEITDNGRGLPVLIDPNTAGGLGFQLIRALATQLGAVFAFESSESGVRFWLRFSTSALIT